MVSFTRQFNTQKMPADGISVDKRNAPPPPPNQGLSQVA